MEDENSVNQSKEHSSGAAVSSPLTALDEGLAGRELDMAVAECVLGWKRGARWGNGNGGWTIAGKPYEEHHTSWSSTPKFSTDIAAAMEVVEKMKETRNVEIRAGKYGGGWYVCFEPDSFRRAAAGGPELPDVICRAALAALAPNVPASRRTATVG